MYTEDDVRRLAEVYGKLRDSNPIHRAVEGLIQALDALIEDSRQREQEVARIREGLEKLEAVQAGLRSAQSAEINLPNSQKV